MSPQQAEQRVTIVNTHGLHARPASEFVKLARGFTAEIRVRNQTIEADGKAMMHLLSLGACQGTELIITAAGDDAEAAVAALAALVAGGFPEPNDAPSN
ncbi:MAG: HPr family phosphocarrier protein [Pirellulales bacterium]|nr:HPr family phosphocarrier protein [Pirellulales bacterium]